MRVTIPFSYVTDVITSGGNRATRHYSETFEIDVPEVSATEAPVALRWRGEKPIVLDHRGNAPAVPVDVRAHDGFLVEPRREHRWTHGEDDRVQNLTAKELGDCLSGTKRSEYAGPYPLSTFFSDDGILSSVEAKWKGPPKAGTLDRHSHREDARVKALASARKEAAGIVIINGDVHFRVPEPLLVASGAEGVVWMQSDPKHEDMVALFRLDQAQEAAERSAMASVKTATQVTMPPFELVDPSCLRRDAGDMAQTAMMICARNLESSVGREAHRLPIPVIEAFFDLTEEIPRHYQEMIPERLHPICTALCDAVREHVPAGIRGVSLHRYDLERLAPQLGIAHDREDVESLEGLGM